MLLSIVMTTYNGEKYLTEQIDSILKQTYSNFELIIVDDGSEDNTKDIINKYTQIDSRIVCHLNNVNLGCSKNFEKGVLLAKGEYIALCDQDDIWYSDKLQVLLNYAIKTSSELVYSGCDLIDGKSDSLFKTFKSLNPINGMDSGNEDLFYFSQFNSFILGCSMLIRKDAMLDCVPFDSGPSNHDKWIVFNISRRGSIRYLEQSLFSYRIHQGNLSIKNNKLSFKEKIKRKLDRRIVSPFYDSSIVANFRGEKKSDELYNDLLCFEQNRLLDRVKFVIKYKKYIYQSISPVNRIKGVFWLVFGTVKG